MLKISVCSENCKEACWKFQNVLKTVTHVVCLKFQCMLKTVMHVQNYVEYFRCVENMPKTSRHVENYNMCRKLCWKFQHVLKTVMHVESHVKTSRCVENVYVRRIENHIENCVEVQKKTPSHFTTCVEIEWQISFFSFGFARVTEVRHIYVSFRLRMQNAVPAQPCVGKLVISLVLLNFLHCNFRLWFKTP